MSHESERKTLEVAVGVILDEKTQKVFVAQRQSGRHLSGCWEFPGGKLEPGEAADEALVRELKEELAIVVTRAESLTQITHDYPERRVRLHCFRVRAYEGEPMGNEGQKTAWFTLDELQQANFPEANRPLIAALRKDIS